MTFSRGERCATAACPLRRETLQFLVCGVFSGRVGFVVEVGGRSRGLPRLRLSPGVGWFQAADAVV